MIVPANPKNHNMDMKVHDQQHREQQRTTTTTTTTRILFAEQGRVGHCFSWDMRPVSHTFGNFPRSMIANQRLKAKRYPYLPSTAYRWQKRHILLLMPTYHTPVRRH
jgi:hypothetical protein